MFISDLFGNVSGGRRQGFREKDLLVVDLSLETDKLLGWPGGEFKVGFANGSGTNISTAYIGTTFPVQLAAASDSYLRFTYLSYTQKMADDRLRIRVGRTTLNSVYGQEFVGSEYLKAFTSVAFDLAPFALFKNAPGAFGYPYTTWGARARYEPSEPYHAMVGV